MVKKTLRLRLPRRAGLCRTSGCLGDGADGGRTGVRALTRPRWLLCAVPAPGLST